jgi:hypothetical protein
MRMLKPSPGEVADRSTILELKIEFARRSGLGYRHFEEEEEALDNYLQNGEFVVTIEVKDKYYELRKELLAINRKLWICEDENRSLPSVDQCSQEQILRLATLCKLIADLNDARADLVARMNLLFNITGKEKIYTPCTTN